MILDNLPSQSRPQAVLGGYEDRSATPPRSRLHLPAVKTKQHD
jgi:hypothetical protein